MKKLYKVLFIVAVFWVGVMYAGMSPDDASNNQSTPARQQNTQERPSTEAARPALNEEIQAYEEAIATGETYTPYSRRANPVQEQNSAPPRQSNERTSRQNSEQAPRNDRNNSSPSEITDNFISRGARHIGDVSQTIVRESLRGFVRFFDGIIQ